MYRTEKAWGSVYEKLDALWEHGGNPKQPHALLASKKHSNGFFNSRLVIAEEGLLIDAASDLLEIFVQQGGDYSRVRGVVGPQTGATKLAEFISCLIQEENNKICLPFSPAKREENGVKSMVFQDLEISKLAARKVLLCEDVLTTGGSVEHAEKAVFDASGIVLPYILVLVNRSGLTEVNGKKIIALINRDLPIWMPEVCPLCKEGSEAIPPKGENWALLKASYD